MNTALMSQRPIRELIDFVVEGHLVHRRSQLERRRFLRYSRTFPATLVVDGAEHQAGCVDLSYGGARLMADADLEVRRGDRVQVRICRNGQSFQDRYSVVSAQNTGDGTSVHLTL
jgi:hypothetical protein